VTAIPWRAVPGGLEIRLRVTPRSSADQVAGLHSAADGQVSLMVKVRALPDKGAANAAVIETLADALGIAKSRIALIAGSTGRNKMVRVQGDVRELEKSVAGLLGRLEREKE
jgi:uncharacterized protein YggU (UPF0235/DUF167 family)